MSGAEAAVSGAGFAARYGPWAVIAGGSEGIGAAFAAEVARRGVNVVLVARRSGPLSVAAAALRREHGAEVITVAVDLGSPAAPGQIADAAGDREIGLVVANAATVPRGSFTGAGEAELMGSVDVNCRGAMLLARQFLPAMAGRGRGGMVFVSSLTGMQGVPGLAAYSATKAYLISLGESLWAELRPAGVDVLTVCAGAVSTPGYQVAAGRAAPGMTSPERVAGTALRALGHGPRAVPGTVNRVSAFLMTRLAPRRAAITIYGRASASVLKDEPA